MGPSAIFQGGLHSLSTNAPIDDFISPFLFVFFPVFSTRPLFIKLIRKKEFLSKSRPYHSNTQRTSTPATKMHFTLPNLISLSLPLLTLTAAQSPTPTNAASAAAASASLYAALPACAVRTQDPYPFIIPPRTDHEDSLHASNPPSPPAAAICSTPPASART